MKFNESDIRKILLEPFDYSKVAEPELMAACSAEIILKLDAITMLPDKGQRLVATNALFQEVSGSHNTENGE